MMNPMFSALGVLSVDHYAVTTKDLMTTLGDFLSIPNAKLLRGPRENPAQKVNYAFVDLNGMGVVEILSPMKDDSPIMNHLHTGGGAYHLCYLVHNIDEAVEIAQNQFHAKLVGEPKTDGAFDGRRVAFLVHPVHGLFELLEAYPASLVFEPMTVRMTTPVDHPYEDLLSVYNEVMGGNEIVAEQVTMRANPEWDSFKHLLLIMEIEKEFEVNIPAKDMAKLDSLTKISAYLTEKKR